MGLGVVGGGWQDDGKISSYSRQNLQGTWSQLTNPERPLVIGGQKRKRSHNSRCWERRVTLRQGHKELEMTSPLTISALALKSHELTLEKLGGVAPVPQGLELGGWDA